MTKKKQSNFRCMCCNEMRRGWNGLYVVYDRHMDVKICKPCFKLGDFKIAKRVKK